MPAAGSVKDILLRFDEAGKGTINFGDRLNEKLLYDDASSSFLIPS
jgi:hypothetical protein